MLVYVAQPGRIPPADVLDHCGDVLVGPHVGLIDDVVADHSRIVPESVDYLVQVAEMLGGEPRRVHEVVSMKRLVRSDAGDRHQALHAELGHPLYYVLLRKHDQQSPEVRLAETGKTSGSPVQIEQGRAPCREEETFLFPPAVDDIDPEGAVRFSPPLTGNRCPQRMSPRRSAGHLPPDRIHLARLQECQPRRRLPGDQLHVGRQHQTHRSAAGSVSGVAYDKLQRNHLACLRHDALRPEFLNLYPRAQTH